MFDFQEQEDLDLTNNRKLLLKELELEFGENLTLATTENISIVVSPSSYIEKVLQLKDNFGFNFFLNLWISDNIVDGENFELMVQLLNMDTHQRAIVTCPVTESQTVPSLSDIYQGAFWCEQESWDMFGVSFESIPKERILSPEGMEGFTLRKNFEPKPFRLRQSFEYSFSPDPRIPRNEWKKRSVQKLDMFAGEVNGPLRAIVEVYDEVIERGRLEIGYLHRGVEKIFENLSLNQILPHLSRLNTNSPTMYQQAWCGGIEKYLDVHIPDRAKALRMVFNELDRIYEHLDTIGRIVDNLGCNPYLKETIKMQESILLVMKKYSGQRLSGNLICLGGVKSDVPKGWLTECLNLLGYIEKTVHEVTKLISNSTLWMNRLCRFELNSKQAMDWGVSGPNLRASGVNYDMRKVSPHYFYNDIEFEVPLGINGQCYDRYLVRVEEIFQSLSIISQLLDNLPLGDTKTKDSRVLIPRKQDVYSDTNALIQHYRFYDGGLILPEGEFYNSIESSNGELGFYVHSRGESALNRVKLRTPGFYSGQCFTDICEGGSIEELPLVINSLNLVVGEIDR